MRLDPPLNHRSYEFLGKKVFGDADEAGWVDALGSAFAWPCSDPSCSWLAGCFSQAAKPIPEMSKTRQSFFMWNRCMGG
jgi:hypothetical protein